MGLTSIVVEVAAVTSRWTKSISRAMSNIRNLLGLHPSDTRLSAYITSLSNGKPGADDPQVKSYPDAVYFNYFPLGLSLLFTPTDGYKPLAGLTREDIMNEQLVLESIDIYNVPELPTQSSGSSTSKPKARSTPAYSTFPISPLTLSLPSPPSSASPSNFELTKTTTAVQFVSALGEPDRKGGGSGPSSGSIGIWCEWSKQGLMVEFGGEEARGPKAWETGKDAVWGVVTLFEVKT
ncbi:hypothetical protein JAAARDRAFT_377973 [Jaapia argillacea MUCL 33604]|uniref:Uncharacterized protein n=1 Tax=Jaapia argillacea MUCL 33604 TaxID=933084 RepID=A0A067QIV0_9AGAM|nr:hypothetical protein JAAARDRAFT_377973 [Jaapia argillacea MUCL 33604]